MYIWDTALAGCHELCHALYNKFTMNTYINEIMIVQLTVCSKILH